LRKVLVILLLVSIFSLSISVSAQSRKRRAPKRSNVTAAKTAAAERTAAELKIGREKIAAQMKILTQFLYLYAGISKGIETVDQTARARDASSVTVEANERNKAKVKESIRNIRAGLDRLESDFRFSPTLKSYYAYITGVSRAGADAENQAGANRFDEAGRSLLKAVNQLTDALVWIH
jgi:hypothetical protein